LAERVADLTLRALKIHIRVGHRSKSAKHEDQSTTKTLKMDGINDYLPGKKAEGMNVNKKTS